VPLYAFGAGTLFPALATLTSFATDADSQGSILGGSQVVGGFGRVAGPIWAGLLFQTLSIRTPFFVAALCAIAALVLASWIPATLQLRRHTPLGGAPAPAAAGEPASAPPQADGARG
jgi:MFS transporter, DHA1 family, tetracycline resistance protein